MLWSALLLGLGGSLHCIGMCGPIALALPLSAQEQWEVIRQALIYHLGRVLTYVFLGGVFGGLGWGMALLGYQNGLSIFLGMVLIMAALFSFSMESAFFRFPILTNALPRLKNKLLRQFKINGQQAAFKIGLLNGLLPCGLVYMALAGALATGHYVWGMLYMCIFGLGTLPLLLALMVFGKYSRSFLPKLRQLQPFFLFGFGLFLIYRGMLLEVPTELTFWEATRFPIRCH
ncbi:MAG: sulfite exporter TauE/SafE family protein [Bacteroidota bacterium]